MGRRKTGTRRRSTIEAKMTAIFTECRRVMQDNGVMTVMFTHKKAEAWDALGHALISAGFTIEGSWPVNTESEVSSHHQANNYANSHHHACLP